MMDHRDTLRAIRTFPQLVKFLRDELDWPIDSDDFEELTFDYTPEELGIDAASAAKIQEIKRLRPLSAGQPWGIFFVKFEPRRLPVVALRRVLSRVVLKKRASANSAERAAWQADDLLFVSNYGEGDERQISFAHFSQDRTKADLPILKVLGWNNRDTALHLDGVATELATKLSWPEDESNVDRWREKWRSAFTLRPDEVIKTSKALAVELAKLARRIRDRIHTVLAIETEHGPVTKLMKAFQEALVHDLDADGFADMYAQTIAYGLLSARVTNPKANTADGFAAQLPVTNPFLKELMETFLHVGGRKGKAGRGPGIDFDELGVSEVVELLDDANMEAVVRDFGDKNPQEDPVIHFYELFLKEYDAKKRMQRGVFYTPRPVVSFIVRSVHELLQTEFGLTDGLAATATWGEMAKRHAGLTIPKGAKPTDRFVTILDPATGTGTFLVEAIEVIHRTLVEKWKREGHGDRKILDLWNDYVPKHLLPRLHGYELLMAPYAIAHLKIGLKLHETGYRFENDERARVYLTNALEPAHDFSGTLAFAIPALAHEAEAVNEVKRHQRFTVVIGNPPYSGISANIGEWIQNLVRSYYFVDGKSLGERNPKWLLDDYVKFLRLSEATIEASGFGVVGVITNHGFVANPTFRGLRYSLLNSFDRLYVLDLHGNQKRREESPSGTTDENVFDIQQGVSISVLLRGRRSLDLKLQVPAQVFHCDLWGSRDHKYGCLINAACYDLEYREANPHSEFWLLRPQNEATLHEYEQHPKLSDLFLISGVGMTTARDYVVIDFDSAPLIERATTFRDFRGTDSDLCAKLEIPEKQGWDIQRSRELLRAETTLDRFVTPVAYRPFDNRYIFYHDSLVWRTVKQVMRHMRAGRNVALVSARSNKSQDMDHFYCTRLIMETKCGEATTQSCLFPLYTVGVEGGLGFEANRQSNLDARVVGEWFSAMGLRAVEEASPEGVFNYAYAVFYSPGYRTRYAEFLKIDFPRLPLSSSLELFRELARIGGELVALHLVEAPAQQALSARYDRTAKAWRSEIAKVQRLPATLSFNGPEKPIVGKLGWSDDTVWIDAVKPKSGAADAKVTGTVGFRGVPEEVWNFHIGGYQVCEKWLKDRKDRTLTADDIAHYHRIVIALHETIRLMADIDEVIDAHGGWPGAFQDAEGAVPSDARRPPLAAEEPARYRRRRTRT